MRSGSFNSPHDRQNHAELSSDSNEKIMMRTLIILAFLLALASTTSATAQHGVLYLYGDADHKKFLGCLNCDRSNAESVCNRYSSFGSTYGLLSIWNSFGNFGSKYSMDSPWSKNSSSPPIIVDENGNSYGALTTNKYHRKKTQIEAFEQLTEFFSVYEDLDTARALYCGALLDALTSRQPQSRNP